MEVEVGGTGQAVVGGGLAGQTGIVAYLALTVCVEVPRVAGHTVIGGRSVTGLADSAAAYTGLVLQVFPQETAGACTGSASTTLADTVALQTRVNVVNRGGVVTLRTGVVTRGVEDGLTRGAGSALGR